MAQNNKPVLALIGYGKLGHEIEALAKERGFVVRSIIDPQVPGMHKEITAQNMEGVDVCIEISQPDTAIINIQRCAALGKDIVVGTTGWYERMSEVETIVRTANIGCIYASNFLMGMHAFAKVIKAAGSVFQPLSHFDAAIHESHHAKKVDAPSGTALMLGHALLSTLFRKKNITAGVPDVSERKSTLQITSTRVGDVPGIHTVIFDSGAECIELTHSVRSRAGFAEGALAAASWIHHKKGFYSMEDMINE